MAEYKLGHKGFSVVLLCEATAEQEVFGARQIKDLLKLHMVKENSGDYVRTPTLQMDFRGLGPQRGVGGLQMSELGLVQGYILQLYDEAPHILVAFKFEDVVLLKKVWKEWYRHTTLPGLSRVSDDVVQDFEERDITSLLSSARSKAVFPNYADLPTCLSQGLSAKRCSAELCACERRVRSRHVMLRLSMSFLASAIGG